MTLRIRSDNSKSPIELLSPAGDLVCARAAVENGADAIYFGLDEGLNDRARATNISQENLDELMDLVHGRGVNGYLTLKTLVFPGELSKCIRIIKEVAQAGVDAVLVQDLGVARLVREICREMSIHASTQMTLTSAECTKVAAKVGIDRVVLARELSIPEIKQIAAESVVPLEVFCHGALGVAYSGQCLTSESLGGRSANRGQCAQACRLPYDLLCDGDDVDLEEVKYLLSPQDSAAFKLIPELIDAGVISFKIEGRLKSPEYVANVTRRYRQAIDSAITTQTVHLNEREIEEMELSLSRGFSPGWLNGCDHKMLVPGLSSSKRGVLSGQIREVGKSRVKVQLSRVLKVGDGIVFDGDRAANQEQGGRFYEIFIHQHMPMFHMEHCVFCAVLSPGTNKTNCGRPCDVHEVHLQDRVGMEHLLTADVGCRNTLLNAQLQSAAEIVPELTRKGVSAFRAELLGNETPQTVELIVSLYQKLLGGRADPGKVWKRLKASNRVGVTRGTMETRRDPLAIL